MYYIYSCSLTGMLDLSTTMKSRVAPMLDAESHNKSQDKGGISDKKNARRKASTGGGGSTPGLPGGKKKKKKINPLRPIYKFFRLNKRLRTGLEVRSVCSLIYEYSNCKKIGDCSILGFILNSTRS